MYKIKIILLSLFFFSHTAFADFKNEVITKLQSINSLEFNFKQETEGEVEQGKCFMQFPGKMKCIYQSEDGKEILVAKNQMYIIKKKFERAYRYPIKNTQFSILLDKIELAKNINKIENYQTSNSEVTFNINTENGISVKIFFDKNSKILKGWETISINQTKSKFEIIEPAINTKFSEKFSVPSYGNF